jgi:hypothetical protein
MTSASVGSATTMKKRQPGFQEAFITTTWDGKPVNHKPVHLHMAGDGDHLQIDIVAPFFNDPRPPCLEEGACFGLWDYEGTMNSDYSYSEQMHSNGYNVTSESLFS